MMKRQRILALLLASTMTFSSISTVYAEDAAPDSAAEDSFDDGGTDDSDDAQDDADNQQDANEDSDSDSLNAAEADDSDSSDTDEDSDSDSSGSDSSGSDSSDSDSSDSEDEENDAANNSSDKEQESESSDAEEETAENDKKSSSNVVEEESQSISETESESSTEETSENLDASVDLMAKTEGNYTVYDVKSFSSGHTVGGSGIDLKESGGSVKTDSEKNKWGAGKWSEGQDQFPYYYFTEGLDLDKNFKLSATVSMDKIAGTGQTNKCQSSFGLLVFATRGGDSAKAVKDNPPSVSLYASYDKSLETSANVYGHMVANSRKYWDGENYNNGDGMKRLLADDINLSELFAGGVDVGEFRLTIEKFGNVYTFTVEKIRLKAVESDDEEADDSDKPVVEPIQTTSFIYDSRNFTGVNDDIDKIYPAMFSARDAQVTFRDIELKVENREIESVEITKAPSDYDVYYGATPSFKDKGMEVTVNYSNGDSEVTDKYEIKGLDVNTLGTQEVFIAVGDGAAMQKKIIANVVPRQCTELEFISVPMKQDYYEGQYLRTGEVELKATYADGGTEEIKGDRVAFYIDGKDMTDKFITHDMAKDKPIEVEVRQIETKYVKNRLTKTEKFNITISPYKLGGISIASMPAKTIYYLNEEQNVNGLSAKAMYYDDNNQIKATSVLQESEYTVSNDLDTTSLGKKAITVTSNFDKTKSTSFNVEVSDQKVIGVELITYPRTTYPLLSSDKYNENGWSAKEWFDYYNGLEKTEEIEEDGKKVVKPLVGTMDENNETKQYNMANMELEYIYSSGNRYSVPESEYTLNLENFDLTKETEGGGSIVIEFPEGSRGYGQPEITVPVTVSNKYDITVSNNDKEVPPSQRWRPVIFGASATISKMGIYENQYTGKYKNNKPETKEVALTVDHGTDNGTSSKNGLTWHKNVSEGKEEFYNSDLINGTPGVEGDVESIRIMAGQGAGKIADSNDGMAYYYTRLNSKDNFKISADINVNQYVNGNEDQSRDGQEGFGIMARDIVPFASKTQTSVSKGTTTILHTDKISDAYTDKYGEPIPLSTTQYSYSNMVMIGGHSGSGWPSDPKASNYEFNTEKNRINLIYRTYIDNQEAASSDVYRSGVEVTLSNDFPYNHKYHISLEKINGRMKQDGSGYYGGYKGVCYDYSDKQFRTHYIYYSENDAETDLNVIDPDNIYVGFFASRYADITVRNIKLTMSNPKTDATNIVETANKKTTPKISLNSSSYSTTVEYNLRVRPGNNSGGYLTIKQYGGGGKDENGNDLIDADKGKIIYSDMYVTKRSCTFPVTLKENSTTRFEVVYKPAYMSEDNEDYQELTSYNPVYDSYVITHKGNFDKEKKFIYVAPEADEGKEPTKQNGTPTGAGTIDDPMTFDIAVGLFGLGQYIILLPGTYKMTGGVEIPETSSGLPDKPKGIIGYDVYEAEEDGYAVEGYTVANKPVVFDFQGKSSGFVIAANYMTLKNFEVCNSKSNSKPFHFGGSNSLLQNIKCHDNGDSGFAVSRVDSSKETIRDWPSNNIMKYCEVWNSADSSYNNADGFAIKLTIGYGNKMINCVSHHNADDGWDLFCKMSGGYIAPVTLENCIAYKGGYKLVDGDDTSRWSEERGGRNGFKMGGDYMPINHVMKNCYAFENGNSGVTSNSNPLLTMRDCVSYKNAGSNITLYSSSTLVPQAIQMDENITKDQDIINDINSGKRNTIYNVQGCVSYKGGSPDSIQDYTHKDYNYLALTDKNKSTNATGDKIVDESYFENLDNPVVKGRLPQDPVTKEFLMNGFIKVKQEKIEEMHAVEGYTEVKDIDYSDLLNNNSNNGNINDIVDSINGGHSSSSSGSSSSGGGSGSSGGGGGSSGGSSLSSSKNDKNQNSGNESSKPSESEQQTSGGTSTVIKEEVVKDVTVTAEDLSANNNIVQITDKDANVYNITIPKSEENISVVVPGVSVYVPPVGNSENLGVQIKKAEVLSQNVQGAGIENVVYVDVKEDGKSVDLSEAMWMEVLYDSNVANTDKLVAVRVNEDGTTDVIKGSYYDPQTGSVMVPISEAGNYGVLYNNVEFRDLQGQWAKEYVEALAARKIINGVSNEVFDPNSNITRGDFTKILIDIIDVEPTGDVSFSDVDKSAYYYKEIAAAKEFGIVNGISANEFGAKQFITRQDMMVILARTLDKLNIKADKADLSKFDDSANISAYAKDGVATLVGAGFVNGDDKGNINPNGNLTRAEAAKVLYMLWNKR